MIIKRQLVLAVFLGLCFSAANADSGYFSAVSIGSASLDDDFDGYDIDDNSTSFRISGGWRVNDYFALEAGYLDFGKFEQSFTINGTTDKVSLSADGFTLGVIGSFPIADKFSIFGRAGGFFWDGNAKLNDVTQANPKSINRYLGAGVSYAIDDKFLLTADWTRYDLVVTNSGIFSLGLQYRFGS